MILSRFEPTARFAREAFTPRTIVVLAIFFTTISLALLASRTFASSCSQGESLLSYPVYSKKGLITGSIERCGQPHRGCALLATGEISSYSCSPFMAPADVHPFR